jgi:hypothetical protein
MEAPMKNNWFVRVLIVAFCGFLGTLVVYRYFYVDPKAEISGGLLVILAFILVLVLSELFDNFSIGQLITVSRELKRKEVEAKSLKEENSELRGHIVAISNNVTQRQTSTNIVGLPTNLADMLTVRKAAPEEIETKNIEEQPAVPAGAEAPARPERTLDRAKAEDLAIGKFVTGNSLQAFNLIRDAKLSTQFSGIDPITDITPIFDGYLNTSDSEVFIEVRPSSYASMMFRDRLYVMLTKLHHYKTIKKANVYLALLLLDFPEFSSRPTSIYLDRLQRDFGPAIASGLLRIHQAEFSAEEREALYSGAAPNAG